MKLRLFYKNNNNVIYSIVIGGDIHYYYDGFESTEEAKTTLREEYIKAEQEKRPNIPTSVTECIIDNMLNGIWNKIE